MSSQDLIFENRIHCSGPIRIKHGYSFRNSSLESINNKIIFGLIWFAVFIYGIFTSDYF
jgi:hypothetical protein